MAGHARRDFLEEVRTAVEADGRYIMREDPDSDRVFMRKKGVRGPRAQTSEDVGGDRAFTVAASVAKLYRTWFGRNRGEWPANLPLVKPAETAAAMQVAAEAIVPRAPRPDRLKVAEMMKGHTPRGKFQAIESWLAAATKVSRIQEKLANLSSIMVSSSSAGEIVRQDGALIAGRYVVAGNPNVVVERRGRDSGAPRRSLATLHA